MSSANSTLIAFDRLIRDGACLPVDQRADGPLKVGVDLGTANLVLAVVDAANQPVAGATRRGTVARDGIVVDYVGAVSMVREMKAELEDRLGLTLDRAATAIPPGITPGNAKAIGNVVEAADMDLVEIIDEPVAAARALGLRDGAVVDVGGGTTGISVLCDGAVIDSYDEATGGTHMTLVLAGALGLDFDAAEEMKLDLSQQDSVFPVILPVTEKMASITERFLRDHAVDTVHLVGGACSFDQFDRVFARATGRKVVKPARPLLVTPLGIAMWGTAVPVPRPRAPANDRNAEQDADDSAAADVENPADEGVEA